MVSRKTAAINVNNAETIIYNGLYSDYENSKWIQISRHVMKKIKVIKANLINN